MDFLEDLREHIKNTRKDKYARGGVETIELIKSKFDLESFALGNVVKYVSRYPTTKDKGDLLKAAHYIAMVYDASTKDETSVIGEIHLQDFTDGELLRELIRRKVYLDCVNFVPGVGCIGHECVDWEGCDSLPKRVRGGCK